MSDTTEQGKQPKRHTINDLREQLFVTLKRLNDPENPMPPEQARAVSDISKNIIDSAKVEVDLLRVIGGEGSTGFVPLQLGEGQPSDDELDERARRIMADGGRRRPQP